MSTINLSPDADAAANYDRNDGGMNQTQETPGRSTDVNDPKKTKSSDSDQDRNSGGSGSPSRSSDKSGKPQQ